MAKPEAPTQTQQNRSREPQAPTVLIGRSRGQRPFTRAGVQFQPDWQAIPLEQLDEDRVRRILAEPMLDARLGTDEDAERLGAMQRAEYDENVSRQDLVRAIVTLEQRVKRLEARNESLTQQLMSDRAPRTADVLKQS